MLGATVSQRFSVPENLQNQLESRLQVFGHSLKDPKKLADAVIKLSDFFIRGLDPKSSHDYWSDAGSRAAYISYFAVLNFVRAQSVFSEAKAQRFLLDTRSLVDWGCGAGSALWALAYTCPEFLPAIKIHAIDRSLSAVNELTHWKKTFNFEAQTDLLDLKGFDTKGADTVLLSYVLNEAEFYPIIPESVRRLIVIEPSTHQASRKLLAFRDKKIEEGWYAWAPCTHQEFCPLYNQSGRDWCHHRVHWEKPIWFQELQHYLPMKNDTLTLSYVLLSRDKPVRNLDGLSRIVGDEQPERGKTRQMICRGVNREFLSWLDRNRLKPGLKRGDLIRIRDGINKPKEVRISFISDIEKIDVDN